MVSRIRAAVKISKPPLAVIFNAPTMEWSSWDFKLVKALELYDEMKTGTGMPIYWDRSDRVRFEVGSYTSKSKAVLDRAEEKAGESKSKNYGKVFYATPKTMDGGMLPTLDEWLAEQEEKRARTAGNFRVPEAEAAPFSNANWKPKNKGVELG